MSEWRETTIGRLLSEHGGSVKTGPFGTTLKASEYSTVGVPLISVREVGYGSLRVDASTPRVPLEVTERLPEYLLRWGDIVFGRKGAVDRAAHVNADQDGWFLGSDGIRLRLPDVCDSRFIAYQIQSQQLREWLLQHATGTTMASLNQEVIGRMPIVLPPIQDQQTIAHILGTLDDKIELNRRTNETLEAMARAIFKSWFVDFDPVRAKASGESPESICRRLGLTPELLTLFPECFDESELGEIPTGWEVGTLGDVANHPRRGVQPNEIHGSTPYIALEHMPRHSIALADWDIADGLESNKFEFKRGEILFGKLRPYFHKVGVAPVSGVCSTDIVVIKPRSDDWFGYVLGHVSSDVFVDYTNAGSTGTKMPRTSWKEMATYAVAKPPEAVAAVFTRQIGALVNRVIASIHESRELTRLRDSLLPKLLSGGLLLQTANDMEEMVCP